MKKLYIPTTTLNFNNILSSESVSPKSFYEKRGFGYNRWFSIPENNHSNVILLYESLCSFSRSKSDYEDHPLLIEVLFDEESISDLTNVAEGTYTCDHTIYLTPWKTKFIFFSDEDKRVTLSMSDSSLETKLLKLYSKRFSVESPDKKYNQIAISDHFEPNLSEIEKDICINKMKGVLYGYYIGALLSTTLEPVKQLNVLREILNIFAAILSSLDKAPTEYQRNRLDFLFKKMRKTNPFYTKLLEIIGDENKTDDVFSLIRDEYGFSRSDIDERRLLSDLQVYKEQTGLKNPSLIWIENKLYELENEIHNNFQPLSTNKGEMLVMDNKLSSVSHDVIKDEIENRLFIYWINNLFSSKKYNGKISSFKDKFSDDATSEAKEIYQEKWADSYAKIFLNNLRRHVRGDEFNQQWNNGIFSSLAAVVTNGGEWSKLLTFMQSKEMNDYRIAFAMFGALNGFANLTRDFTDVVYSCDSKYIEEIYKEFHDQLFGYSPIIELSSQIKEDTTTKINIGDNASKEQILKNTETKKEPIANSSTISDQQKEDTLSTTNRTLLELELSAFNEFTTRDKATQKEIITKLNIINIYSLSDWDEKIVGSIEWTTKKGQKKIVSAINKSKQKNSSSKANLMRSNPNLFIEEKPSEDSKFYKDKNALLYLAELLPDEKKVRALFKNDLDWFQGNYQEKYQEKDGTWKSGNYHNNDKDNNSVIEHFRTYLKDKILQEHWKKKVDSIKAIYKQIDIDAIISKLKGLYLNGQ
jgi:hypothetical protein